MFNNLHLYAIILIAILLIIALAVIYLNNKRITTLTQQLKKNTFELSAMQSVIEGHLMNGGSGALHQDIHMTTTPTNTPTSIPSPTELSRQQTLSNSQYYGDYASHLDGQQYTKSGGPNETESESSSELLDEEDLTDYDEEDGGADELDDILNNFVEDADDLDNADNASIVDENDIVEVDNTSENIVVAEVDDDDADIDNSEVVEENIVEDVVVEDSDEDEETTTEPNADSEPERKTKKKRTPNTSARDHDVGTIVLSENDNNYYTVYETTTGKKRWRKVKDQSSVNVDTTEVLQSELAPIPEEQSLEEQSLNVIDIDGTDDATTE
jgi:type II secretory pathway pseudopilin PulG